MELKYHKELDGVRAIAALMIIFFHFFQTVSPDNNTLFFIKRLSIFGQTGVSLFFVLSGFLITRILLTTKGDSRYYSNFYIRRSLRIFPLYYFFLVIFYNVLPLFTGGGSVVLSRQIYYWIYLQGFAMTFNWPSAGPGHFWSLAIEEHFYLLWPLLIYYLNRRWVLISIGIMILSSTILRLVMIKNNLDVFYFTFTRWDEIAVGALLAILEIDKKLVRSNSSKLAFLFFLLTIPTISIWILNDSSGNTNLQIFKYLLLSSVYFSIIACIISFNDTNFIKRFLRIKPLIFTGRISYGLYVYHPLCFMIFHHFYSEKSIIIDLLGSYATSYAMATLSYYLLESNFLKLKHYFGYRQSGLSN